MGVEGRPIDDEHHVLFECEATRDCRVRLLDYAGDPMTVEDMMSGLSVRLAEFVSECMDTVESEDDLAGL